MLKWIHNFHFDEYRKVGPIKLDCLLMHKIRLTRNTIGLFNRTVNIVSEIEHGEHGIGWLKSQFLFQYWWQSFREFW